MTRRPLMTLIGLALLVSTTASASARAAVTITSFTAEAASTVAGGHVDVSTSFVFQPISNPPSGFSEPAGGNAQDIVIQLPPGLVGRPTNVPACPRSLFTPSASAEGGAGCPADTQVGTATLTLTGASSPEPTPYTTGVFNVQPGPDEPALLGIQGQILDVGFTSAIHVSASATRDYALSATVHEVPEFPLKVHTLAASVTLWGIPAAHPRGDGGSTSVGSDVQTSLSQSIPPASASRQLPFMENPTDCSSTPVTTISVDTYQEPEVFSEALASAPIPTDCADVPFAPSIALTPDTAQAGAPTGIGVDLTVPQSNDPNGAGTSELERAVVTLPRGMTISPSAASSGLQGCTNEQFGADSDEPADCPAASVIGEDEVQTPLLPQTSTGAEGKLTGKVYLGQPLSTDPTSGQMFRIFQELHGYGLDVKIAGSVVANPQTGQLTATFSSLPELPFQSFRLHFNGGPNAVLVNPQACGQNTTTTQLYPYSASPPASPSSTFTTGYDGNGAPCPAVLPFAPSSSISTTSRQAGATSPLSVTFARADETQPLGQIDAKLPAGLLGYVSKIPLCQAAQAVAGTCSPESRIGTISTTTGAGPDPLAVQGSVYLARGSDGYPFMLSAVVPAIAGPFDLGNVVVPVWLQVNSDGSLTAASGSLPSILDGIPLDIRSVTMTIDRPGFTFNPTNCGLLSMIGSASSLSGTVATIAAPFQVAGCGSLPFAPSFTVATEGSTSKANGASLTVRIAQNPGEADIHSVHVELPKQLPSRLTTLQKACTEAQFHSNPAGCPPGSVVGTATAITPTLSSPLTGPAFLVSRGGAAFPDIEIILQGEGVTVVLDGATDIKQAITSSTFAAVPDVPISDFELNLPEGPHSLLGSTGTLCSSKLPMPTKIVGQNGATVARSTLIAVTGCPKSKPGVAITKTKAKANGLLVTVTTTAEGTVRISGRGLDAKTKKNLEAGTSRIEVRFTQAGRALRARHEMLKLHASLTAGRLAVAKTTSVKL